MCIHVKVKSILAQNLAAFSVSGIIASPAPNFAASGWAWRETRRSFILPLAAISVFLSPKLGDNAFAARSAALASLLHSSGGKYAGIALAIAALGAAM